MSDQFPVFVAVSRPDGSMEKVRVGSAVKSADGFTLQLGALSIGGSAEAPRAAAPRTAAPAGAGGGMVFPPYGRSKGAPIGGASMQDLDYYANGCRRTLSDPGKARWHDKEKLLLAAIEGEIARQSGSGGGSGGGGAIDPGFGDEPPPPGDSDAPPEQ